VGILVFSIYFAFTRKLDDLFARYTLGFLILASGIRILMCLIPLFLNEEYLLKQTVLDQ
jgi:hypothetical protein